MDLSSEAKRLSGGLDEGADKAPPRDLCDDIEAEGPELQFDITQFKVSLELQRLITSMADPVIAQVRV